MHSICMYIILCMYKLMLPEKCTRMATIEKR